MGFEKCHPAVNFIYFAGVIAGTIAFQHPIFLVISFLCAFLYSIKRNGWKALVFNLVLLPLIVAFALYYSSYHHFGITVLEQNMIGNNMTLESLVYGFVLGAVVAGVLMWFSCVSHDPPHQKGSEEDQHSTKGHRQRRKSRQFLSAAKKLHPHFLHADHMDDRIADHSFGIHAQSGQFLAGKKSLFHLPL